MFGTNAVFLVIIPLGEERPNYTHPKEIDWDFVQEEIQKNPEYVQPIDPKAG